MPEQPTYPVPIVLELRDQEEHVEMFQLAKEVRLDFPTWALKVLRAAAKEAKNRR